MHVLIIDGNAQVSGFIKKGLRVEGHHISIALNGTCGLAMMLSSKYDIIILDLILPDMNGLEVCQQLRQQDLQTPILVLSTLDTVDVKVKSLDIGADDFLVKPFAFEELLARINALQRRSGAHQTQESGQQLQRLPILQVADLRLNHQLHEVQKSGKIVNLTPTEFVLLEYLMQHSNHVVSRTMIEDQVWGYEKDPLTNIVDVYIRRLRKKLDAHRLIKTVRGVGYQLSEPAVPVNLKVSGYQTRIVNQREIIDKHLPVSGIAANNAIYARH